MTGRWRRRTRWLATAFAASAWLAGSAAATTYAKNGYHYDVGPAPAWVKPPTPPAQWDAGAPGAEGSATETWRTWIEDLQLDRRHGGRELYVDMEYEPLTVASLAEAGRFQFVFKPEFESLTIHRVDVFRDGQWTTRLDPDRITLARRETAFESDMATGAVTALLDLADIRVGDRIRVAYTVKGSNPVLAGLDHDEFTVGWISPLLSRRLRVLFDASAQPLIQHDPGVADGRLSRTADGQEYVEEQRDLPGVHDEGDDPEWFSPHPREEIAQKRTWAQIADWAVGLYPAPKPLPADLMQRIAEWKREPDAASRVARALHAVQDEVRYFGIELGENSHRPAEPADVWTQRQGDCKDKARLLVAILAQMGVTAEPALVASDGGPRLLHQPPSASAFDHVIVHAQVDGKSHWLDPTRTQQRGSLDQAAVSDFSYALLVAPRTDGLVKVERSDGAAAHWRIDETYAPSADGRTTRLEVVTEATGAAAEQMRGRFAASTREKVQKDYSDYYSRRIAGRETVEPLRMDDDAAANKVVVREAYVFDGALTPESGLMMLDTYAEGVGSYVPMPKTMSRHAPLALAYPVDVEQRIELKLPPKWEWHDEAFQKAVAAPGVDYALTASQHDGKVLFDHRFHTTEPVVDLAQMDKHLAARREIQDLIQRRFVLASPTDIAAGQRDERLQHLLKGIMDDSATPDPAQQGK